MSDNQQTPASVAPRHMGDKAEIRGANERILQMIPGAADYPREVLLATAQIAIVYRLDPIMGEIVIAKMGSKKVGDKWMDVYAPLITVKGHRTLARRMSNYTTKTRHMTPEETKEYRRDLYDPGDVGAEITLWRLDIARECKNIDVPYEPTIGVGFWRIKARPKKENGVIVSYAPDEIPETWTAFQVAEKRAELSAIRKAFDLRIPDHAMSDDYDIEVEAGRVLDQRDREHAITQRPEKVTITEDGEVLYAA